MVHNADPDYDYRNLSIGDNVHVGPLVVLDLADVYPRTAEPARVGAGAWIGANATVLVGCEIGECAVVAAGAVVREPVPDGAVVGGVPAEPLTHG